MTSETAFGISIPGRGTLEAKSDGTFSFFTALGALSTDEFNKDDLYALGEWLQETFGAEPEYEFGVGQAVVFSGDGIWGDEGKLYSATVVSPGEYESTIYIDNAQCPVLVQNYEITKVY